jgi:hypothetical protein
VNGDSMVLAHGRRRAPGSEPHCCRRCGVLPGVRDAVGPDAVAYTCSRCLRRGDSRRARGETAISLQAPLKTSRSFLNESATSNTISRDIATGRAGRPGRPRLSDVERRRRQRERQRRYRAGIAG